MLPMAAESGQHGIVSSPSAHFMQQPYKNALMAKPCLQGATYMEAAKSSNSSQCASRAAASCHGATATAKGAGHDGCSTATTTSSSNGSSGSSTQLLDLGVDLLGLITSHCGASAPALAQACRPTWVAWYWTRRSFPSLARVLADAAGLPPPPGQTACNLAHGHAAAAAAASASQQQRRHALARGITLAWSDTLATRTLLRAGADVHADYDAALCRAAGVKGAGAARAMVKLLLKHGADVHARAGAPLATAAARGNADVVRLLLSHGAGVHSPWCAAPCCEGYPSREGSPSPPQLWECYGWAHQRACGYLGCEAMGGIVHGAHGAALVAAARGGHAEVVKLLLDHGADVHAQEGGALVLAARCGHVEVLRLLMAHGAGVVAWHGGLWWPASAALAEALHAAVRSGHVEAARLLLQQPGADVNSTDTQFFTPLDVAVELGDRDMVRLLVALGAERSTLRMFRVVEGVVRKGDVARAEALLEDGAAGLAHFEGARVPAAARGEWAALLGRFGAQEVRVVRRGRLCVYE